MSGAATFAARTAALTLVLTLTAALTQPCGAQTPLQAQQLPVPQLANLVLGAVGTTIIDADRPAWPLDCSHGPLCQPLRPDDLQRRGPPPLSSGGITLYQRAVPTPGGLQWTGLCSSTAIHVSYGEHGRPGQVDMGKRFGLSPSSKQAGPAGGPAQRGDFAQEERECATVTSVAGFFRADDDSVAYEAALASRLFQRAVQSGTPLAFAFNAHCQLFPEYCKSTASVAQRFRIERMFSAQRLPCPRVASGRPKHTCLSVSFGALFGEDIDVEMVQHHDTWSLVRVQYTEGSSEI